MPYPAKYTKALADRICARIAEGRSLSDVCRDKDIPVCKQAVHKWALDDRDGFAEKYRIARHLCSDALFDEFMEMCRELAHVEETPDGPVLRYCEREAVNPIRAKLDKMQWALAKMRPEAYSDKLQLEHQGEQAVKVIVEYVDDPPAPQ